MARTNQTGSGGVLQENTSTLVALRNVRSSTSKPKAKGRVTKAKAKPEQTGKGKRTHRAKVSVVSSSKLKTSKRACASKTKKATTTKTSKKRTTNKGKN